jgi:hypothetical protein
MSLLYIVGSLAGVALIVLINRMVGGYTAACLRSDTEASEVFRQYFPEITASDILVSADGRSALLFLAGLDQLGLVRCHGERYIARVLSPDLITSYKRSSGAVLMSFDDITLPQLHFSLGKDSAASPCLRWLDQMPLGA